MLFTDPFFLFYFLPIALWTLRLCSIGGRFTNWAKGAIVLATLVFYAYENWLWVVAFLLVVVGTYGLGWLISLSKSRLWKRAALISAVGYCLVFIFVFKYLNWCSSLWPALVPLQRSLLPWFGSGDVVTLPPGISFYIFEAISFCVDIERGKIQPPVNPLNFLVFIAMFPRFIAGPIVRYAELEGQIEAWRGMLCNRGLTLFAIGFCMKCLFADQFSVFVPYAFGVQTPDLLQSWSGVLAYTFQLYFDFWSYSIMAIGLGLCLGFDFPDNFRLPYRAKNVGEFWQRWHISLSSWVRDYVYIPLGGNRCASWRLYFNLVVTMALVGLWHGANFTFVLWGAYHGLLLSLERAIGKRGLTIIPVVMRQILTFGAVVVGWALFRSASFLQCRSVLAGMLGLHGLGQKFNIAQIIQNRFAFSLTIAGVIFFILGERWLVSESPMAVRIFPPWLGFAMVPLFVVAMAVAFSSVEIPFLYFQF